ncbi:ankyrin repeat-containing domain protein [Aspergillus pseudodeflectus]|uniref:Ankyrin repeat-containing domain protein n=1 Tax=Aspergillus pseudodeflectus TaxID=176178 RepID=A0ABR4L6D9_9EURO
MDKPVSRRMIKTEKLISVLSVVCHIEKLTITTIGLPMNPHANAYLERFDSMWSHAFVWDLLNVARSQRYTYMQIQESWPIDSTIWFVRTILVMRYGQARRESPTENVKDSPSVLEYIYAMVETISSILSEIEPEQGREGVIARAIALAAKALVLNHEFKDIVTELVPRREGSDVSRKERAREKEESIPLSWELKPDDIFPLLCLTCSAEAIEKFLVREREININKRNHIFGSALYNAAAGNNADVAKLLLEKGADVNATGGRWYNPLHASVAYPTGTESLTLLLAAGADVNAQPAYSINDGRTPLITASHARNSEAVSILLAHKDIDVNITAMSDESIAHYIARAGDPDNLRLLLELHPDVDIKLKGEYGTPLHTAMNFAWYQLTEGHDAVVEILLERGLRPNETCPGAERDIVGWAEEMINEAREEEEEVPAAVMRIIRWWKEYMENVIRRRRGSG